MVIIIHIRESKKKTPTRQKKLIKKKKNKKILVGSYEKILTKPKKILLQKLVLLLKKLGSVTKKLSIYFVDKKGVVEQRKSGVGRNTHHHLLSCRSTYYRTKNISNKKTTMCSLPTICSFTYVVIKKSDILHANKREKNA